MKIKQRTAHSHIQTSWGARIYEQPDALSNIHYNVERKSHSDPLSRICNVARKHVKAVRTELAVAM